MIDYIKGKIIEKLYNNILIIELSNIALKVYTDSFTYNKVKINSIEKLYKEYLTFYSKLNLHEVSYQDQAIELHSFVKEQMKIDYLTEKLDGKFTKLFEFTELQENKKSAEKMDKLTIMGAIFLPPSLMIAVFSMGIFDYEQSEHSLYVAVIAMVFSILVTIGFINLKEKAKKIKEMIVPAVVITIITLLMVLVPIKFIGEKKEKPIEVKIVKDQHFKIDK